MAKRPRPLGKKGGKLQQEGKASKTKKQARVEHLQHQCSTRESEAISFTQSKSDGERKKDGRIQKARGDDLALAAT